MKLRKISRDFVHRPKLAEYSFRCKNRFVGKIESSSQSHLFLRNLLDKQQNRQLDTLSEVQRSQLGMEVKFLLQLVHRQHLKLLGQRRTPRECVWTQKISSEMEIISHGLSHSKYFIMHRAPNTIQSTQISVKCRDYIEVG